MQYTSILCAGLWMGLAWNVAGISHQDQPRLKTRPTKTNQDPDCVQIFNQVGVSFTFYWIWNLQCMLTVQALPRDLNADQQMWLHTKQRFPNAGLQHIMINVCRVSSWGHRHIPILKMDHTCDITFCKNVRKNPHDVSSRFPPCHQIICPLCVLAIICCHLCVSSLSGLCSVCHQVCSLSPTQVAFVDIFTQAVCLFSHGMCSWTHPMIPSVVIANL